MPSDILTVGDLAQRTGLSVRTLHYYDKIGLLSPSLHTAGGYRVYTTGNLERLQQVLMLRQLGLPLADIRKRLEAPDFSPLELIRLYVEHLRKQIESQQSVCERLEAMRAKPATMSEVLAEEVLKTIEAITSIKC